MSTIISPPPEAPELERQPSAGILESLFRMTVYRYERLVETGVLDGQPIELINGLLVRKDRQSGRSPTGDLHAPRANRLSKPTGTGTGRASLGNDRPESNRPDRRRCHPAEGPRELRDWTGEEPLIFSGSGR